MWVWETCFKLASTSPLLLLWVVYILLSTVPLVSSLASSVVVFVAVVVVVVVVASSTSSSLWAASVDSLGLISLVVGSPKTQTDEFHEAFRSED